MLEWCAIHPCIKLTARHNTGTGLTPYVTTFVPKCLSVDTLRTNAGNAVHSVCCLQADHEHHV